MARIATFAAAYPEEAAANNISVAPPAHSVQPHPSPSLSMSNHSANAANATATADRLASSMGLGHDGSSRPPRRPLYVVGNGPQGQCNKKAKVQAPTSRLIKTLGKIWFYGVTSKPKLGYGSNGVTAVIKEDGVDFIIDRVNGTESAVYKRFLSKHKFLETDTLQTSMRQVVKLVMPQIPQEDTRRLDLVASGMMIFVQGARGNRVSMQMLARRALSPEDVVDQGNDWIGSFMGLYRRTRKGQNMVHMVLDPALVYHHWDAIPGEVRVGVLGKEQYRSMHRRQGGLEAGGIDTFLPSPVCGGPPPVADDAASGICAVLSGACAS